MRTKIVGGDARIAPYGGYESIVSWITLYVYLQFLSLLSTGNPLK